MSFVTMMLMNFVFASMLASAERNEMTEDVSAVASYGDGDGDSDESKMEYFMKLTNYLFETDGSGYHHVWPVSVNIYL